MAIRTMSSGQWNKAIARLVALFTKVDASIHDLGCVALAHASTTFDARRMLELYKAFGNSARKKGFLVWVEMFSPIRITDGDKGITVKLAKADDKGYTPFDLAGAEARPFWTLEEAAERTSKPLSADAFLKLVHSFKGKLTKAKNEGKYPIEGDVTKLEALVDDTIATATRRRAQLDAPPPAEQAPRKAKLLKVA